MERSQVLDASRQRRASGTTGELKLVAPEARVPRDGMRAAYDEIIATAVKRQHEPPRVVGDLLSAEINESEPLFALEQQRNVVLIGGTGTGKSQVSIAGWVRCHGEEPVEIASST